MHRVTIFCVDLNMSGHNVNFNAYLMFSYLLLDNTFVQFTYSGLSFLYFMITHNVEFRKNKHRLFPIWILF